jgi:DNA polymerase-3 subunit delta
MQKEKIDKCYLLEGEDDWSKNQFIYQIKNQFLTPDSQMMNYFEFKDKDVNLAKIMDIAETLPFFVDKKIIVIKDSGYFKAGKKEETEKLENYMKSIPDYIILIIDEKEVDKRSKLYKTVKAQYTVQVFDFPGEDVVFDMLQKQSKLQGLTIESAILRYFLRNMPDDIGYIMGEFEKLCSYAGQKPITKQAIEAVCVFSLEKRVFELVKKIANRNAEGAFGIYNTLIQGKESPIGILVLIARQYRVMLQVKYLLKSSSPLKDIAAKVKLPYFVLKEMTAQVSLYTFKELEEILQRCLETDKDIKSGKMDSVKRVEVFIMECLN